MSMSSLNASELSNVSSVLKRPADEFGNDSTTEVGWAYKAAHHAETHFNLISAVDPKLLKLTQRDDEIYEKFREHFKDMDVAVVSDDEMKTIEGKAKWREFCNSFEKVEDFNMATLLRLDSSKEVGQENTTIVPRIQFLAIEIARNREGCNSKLRELYGKKQS